MKTFFFAWILQVSFEIQMFFIPGSWILICANWQDWSMLVSMSIESLEKANLVDYFLVRIPHADMGGPNKGLTDHFTSQSENKGKEFRCDYYFIHFCLYPKLFNINSCVVFFS